MGWRSLSSAIWPGRWQARPGSQNSDINIVLYFICMYDSKNRMLFAQTVLGDVGQQRIAARDRGALTNRPMSSSSDVD